MSMDAKILNKKTPKSKPTILVKNRELEREKEKLKQERLEKRKQVCLTGCFVDQLFASSGYYLHRILPGSVGPVPILAVNWLLTQG